MRSEATVRLRPILFAALLLVATTPLLAQTDTTRVQVSFDGADLREVLRVFAEAAQVPIVLMPLPEPVQITGEQEGPWLEVLPTLLEEHDLVIEWSDDGLVLRIRPREVEP